MRAIGPQREATGTSVSPGDRPLVTPTRLVLFF